MSFFGAAATVVGDEIVLAAPCASLAADESGAVYLFEAGIQTVRTDEDGLYEFTGLEDGTYRVRQRNTTNYATIQTLPGPDATIPAYQVEIDGSAIRASKDFGLSYAPKVVEGQEFVYEISSGTPQEAVNSGNPCEWSPPEGAYIGTVTGNIHPSKVDSGAHLQDWEIVSYNPRNAFRIDDSGRLFVNDSASLLFEKSCTWIIEVSVSDGTRRSLPQAVAVTVRDKAYSPEPIFVSGQVLYPDGGASDPNEDLVVDGRYWNYVVKTVPNPFADYGDFEIVSGNEHGKFWIDPETGELSIACWYGDNSQDDLDDPPNVTSLRISASHGSYTKRINRHA